MRVRPIGGESRRPPNDLGEGERELNLLDDMKGKRGVGAG
jgi:hypothetical protein